MSSATKQAFPDRKDADVEYLYKVSAISYHRSMKTTVSEKGQITIPKAIRDRLGLRQGSVVDFEASDGVLLGRKRVSEDPLLKWRGRGHLPQGLRVDAYIRKARG